MTTIQQSVEQDRTARRRDDYMLVIRSIGAAGPGIVRSLQHVLPHGEAELAALLYRAPSALMTGLERELADGVCAVLQSTGLDVEVRGADEAFEPGSGDHDVALVIDDVKDLAAVIQRVMEITGVDVETAKKIVFASPCVLLGRVSSATVESIRARFAPVGVEIDVSRPRDALFDLFLTAPAPSTRHLLERALRDAGVEIAEAARGGAAEALLAPGLPHDVAERAWERLSRSGASVRILNRDFERFDVRLDAARRSEDLVRWLVEQTGMPRRIVDRAIENAPIVLLQNVPFKPMQRLVEGISRLGGGATGLLIAFQTFSLRIHALGDREASARWAHAVAGAAAAEAIRRAGSEPFTIEGPLTKIQARWLAHELKSLGTGAQMVLR